MEGEEKELGRFGIAIKVFLNKEGNIDYKFNSLDINMPKEFVITQLTAFVNILKENYHKSFKGNITTISGKPT